jgi:hypothetical protein
MAFWGPGAIIAGAMIWALYKLADKFIDKFATEFIKAQNAQAESLGKLAQGTDGLKECVQAFTAKDNTEHQEMLLLLKYIAQHQELYMKVAREHEERVSCGG